MFSFCCRSGCGRLALSSFNCPLAAQHWRSQRLNDEERILLQERVFSAEAQLKSRLATCVVTNQEAESLNLHIKNARAELVSSIAQHIYQSLIFTILAGHMVYATHVSAGRPC